MSDEYKLDQGGQPPLKSDLFPYRIVNIEPAEFERLKSLLVEMGFRELIHLNGAIYLDDIPTWGATSMRGSSPDLKIVLAPRGTDYSRKPGRKTDRKVY